MGRKTELKSAAPEPIMEHKLAKPSHDYEAESAFNDMMRAEEHKNNPDMMARVMKHAKKKKKAINSLADLKVAAAARRKELQEGEGSNDTDNETGE